MLEITEVLRHITLLGISDLNKDIIDLPDYEIEELEKIRKELQLKSVFDGFDGTDKRLKRYGYPVDHIFYRDLQLKAEPHVEKVRTSDHNCIQAEFKLSE